MDIIKNPVVIGLLFGSVSYAYLMWQNKKKNKNKNKDKKKKINIIIPILISFIGWFIAYSYFNYDVDKNVVYEFNKSSNKNAMPLPMLPQKSYKFTGNVNPESVDFHSVNYVASGINIPTKLPEVLLQMY
jgi:hypothetical protein